MLIDSTRRIFFSSLIAAGGLASLAAMAQGAYPNRPVTLVVAYAAGGATDVAARTIAQELGTMWSQSVVVENRPGAGGNIGAAQVARSKPDGYTLIMVAPAHAINVSLYPTPGYQALKDFEPIGRVSFITNMIAIHPSFPAKSVAEIISMSKAKPGSLSYASGGVGTSEHLSAELFQFKAGIKLLHIPYRGTAAAVPDLLSGQVGLTFGNMPALLPHVRKGSLQAISVNGATRSPVLPDVPATTESGLPGFEMTVWLGLLAPAGTPADIVQKINRDLGKVIELKAVKDRLAGLGMEPAFTSADAFRQLIATEVDKYAAVIKAAGLKAE